LHFGNEFSVTLQSASNSYLDFFNNRLRRSNGPSAALPQTLAVRVLEHLMRNGKISVAQFLLLRRRKQSGDRTRTGRPAAALRHELADLRDLIELMGLPIELHRHHQHTTISIEGKLLGSNVADAAALADAATRRLPIDIGRAIGSAGQALKVDPDCIGAACVIVRALNRDPDHVVSRDIVVQAEICLVRSALCNVAGIGRLNACRAGEDANVVTALRRARRFLTWLHRKWRLLRSWPFGDSPSERPDRDPYRTALGVIVEMADAAWRQKGVVEYERFAKLPVVVDITDRLARGRFGSAVPHSFPEMLEAVTQRMCWLMVADGWMPAAASEEQFAEAFARMLRRRVDWSQLVTARQRRRRTSTLREHLHVREEDDQEERPEHRE